MAAECIVVGGGVIGAAVAEAVSAQFGSTLLLEQHRIGHGATGYSGGFVRGFGSSESMCRQTLLSLPYFEQYRQQTGFNQTGILHITPEGFDSGAVARCFDEAGRELREVNGRQAREWFPNLLPDPHARYFFEPGAGYADPVQTTHHMLSRARNRGCRVIEGGRVSRIESLPSGKVQLSTNLGDFTCPRVVICTGAWTPRLLQGFTVASGLRVKDIQVDVLGQVDFPSNSPALFDFRHDVFIRRLNPGQCLVGGTINLWDTEPDQPKTLDLAHSQQVIANLQKTLDLTATPIPNGAKCSADGYFSDGDTGNQRGLIAADPGNPNLLVCAGWSGAGFKAAPAIGQAVLAKLQGSE